MKSKELLIYMKNAILEVSGTETKTLEVQPLSNVVALSTPETIDYMAVVRATAKRKTSNGSLSYSNSKGKQDLFSAVCSTIKSSRGMGKTDKLPDTEAEHIKAVIAEMWSKCTKEILSFGEVTGARMDVPQVKFGKEGVSDAFFTASIHAKRDAKDQSEKNFAVAAKLAGLKRRLEMMDKAPSKYTGDMKRQVMGQIADCENYIAKNQPKEVEVKK